ncbi:hypothetical protein OBBRIDRAFT_807111 [Obba rivulosa]|uniref:Uncharacterized protein n=1 Tax=Obba rivulosa TaxID=1052685 RepID=A0A8E2DGI3_9APHY|nr:hypothetical protein OBBRIDRAFT_807111 [Obba rivulosa]
MQYLENKPAPIDLELFSDAGQLLRETDLGYLELIGWNPIKEQYMPFPPVLYPDCIKMNDKFLCFCNKQLPQVTFILLKDLIFKMQGTKSKINYHLLFEQYKQTLSLSADRKSEIEMLAITHLCIHPHVFLLKYKDFIVEINHINATVTKDDYEVAPSLLVSATASSITHSSASAAASSITSLAPATACSALLSYGIEYTDIIQLEALSTDIFTTNKFVSNATLVLGGAFTPITVSTFHGTGQIKGICRRWP